MSTPVAIVIVLFVAAVAIHAIAIDKKTDNKNGNIS